MSDEPSREYYETEHRLPEELRDEGTSWILEDNRSGALFSEDREYRYKLWRRWDVDLPTIAWIMLNPSTADETELDPTCRRCRGYAESWGYGELVVGNIFALRSTDPSQLYEHEDPVGPDNDDHLASICEEADKVVVAWGAHGDLLERGREVASSLDVDLWALDTTQEGHPVHPLYQPKDAELERFAYEEVDHDE
jgi:hypothetical protein